MAKLRRGAINLETLKDTPSLVISINKETIDYVLSNIKASDGAASLVLADIEERFEMLRAGTYVLPEGLVPAAIRN